MNRNSTDNISITIEHPLAQTRLHVDNREYQNSSRNTSNATISALVMKHARKSLVPTPLYVFCFLFKINK